MEEQYFYKKISKKDFVNDMVERKWSSNAAENIWDYIHRQYDKVMGYDPDYISARFKFFSLDEIWQYEDNLIKEAEDFEKDYHNMKWLEKIYLFEEMMGYNVVYIINEPETLVFFEIVYSGYGGVV